MICCEECPKLYYTSDNIKVRLEKDHESMIYLCEKCDYHFGLPQALSLHIDTEHECVSYKCDQCNQIFCKHPHFYCVFNVDVDNVVVVVLIFVADLLIHSYFHVKPPTTVEVTLKLSRGCDNFIPNFL